MLLDPGLTRAARVRRRTTAAERLWRAISDLAGPRALRLSHQETAWASVTFSGARHSLTLAFEGWEAADDGEAFIAALPDHEFTLPGLLVADAAVVRSVQQLLPHPRLEVGIEVLLLEEC